MFILSYSNIFVMILIIPSIWSFVIHCFCDGRYPLKNNLETNNRPQILLSFNRNRSYSLSVNSSIKCLNLIACKSDMVSENLYNKNFTTSPQTTLQSNIMSHQTDTKCRIPPHRQFQATKIASFTESRRQRFLALRKQNRESYFGLDFVKNNLLK